MLNKLGTPYKTVIFTIVFILLLWFIYQIKDIILMFFVAVILMSALAPTVDRLQRHHVPRGVSIALIYILLWGFVGSLIAAIVPAVLDQTHRLMQTLPASFSQIDFLTSHQQDIGSQVISYLGSLPSDLLKFVVNVFGNVITVLTTVVISFYLLLENRQLENKFARLIDPRNADSVTQTIQALESRLGGWVRGELILMFSIGLFTYLGLTVLGLDIALPLAILAGLMEIIPNIGPIVSAIPAVLIALTVHPLLGLSTAALYVIIQFLENHFLVPKIMQKAAGVHPLLSILALLIGFRVLGSIGTVLSLPFIIIFQVLLERYRPNS